MTGIMQVMLGGSLGFPNGWPVANIGDAYGGGFFAGQLNVSGTKYNLVVAPKASGQSSALNWGAYGQNTGVTSVIDGPTNTTTLATTWSSPPAQYCKNLSIGAYTDWYMPAVNELEVLYYFLKPTTGNNDTGSGSNANAVSPEPISQNYTSGLPAQTTATGVNGFRDGEAEAFDLTTYWTSTEGTNIYTARTQYFGAGDAFTSSGKQGNGNKSNTLPVRAVRRIPI